MSDARNRKIDIRTDEFGTGKLHVDDKNLSSDTRRVVVDIEAGRLPQVTLHMVTGRMALQAEQAEVQVDHATAATLIDLGWTPPGAPAIQVLTESEAKKAIFVLSWHPLDADADPVEVPLGQHWVFPGDVAGEFRLSSRDLPEADASTAPDLAIPLPSGNDHGGGS